ncbi:tetratricopeptide repeat protein [Nocardioides sp.]|jgi:tetratricopeptide (TPR) repeat protein|uniref:tetratricopeptide repeat protein n=1 Tax=Nocardioides sp. TaxID=35761 RepID=UPI003517735B
MHAPDPAHDLWDVDDPVASEARFREAAAQALSPAREVLLSQVARALGLQQRYDEAHAVLDGLGEPSPEVGVRRLLERGRLLRSAGEPEAARPAFAEAVALARGAGLEALEIDAMHMVALVAPLEEQVPATQRALARARECHDTRARDWDASLLNNLGMAHVERGDWRAALAAFDAAMTARARMGEDERTRVARWMVGWALRNLGHIDMALDVQQALKEDLDEIGLEDPYVDEELALLESLMANIDDLGRPRPEASDED